MIKYKLAEIRRDGDRPNYKAVESAAIFECEATMGCVGERECDKKANAQRNHDEKQEKELLDRW